ncbi:50S ribosomal protein L23 [Candidatus Woesearchaeota archaeon]|nr:50S ribosomal protein L23 [Candidatus Woesearchaeota archaeon]
METVILFPLSTEKSMRLIESENKLVFVVDRRASRQQIKSALESLYNLKIKKINVLINREGKKQAFVKLSDDSSALDVATDLGIM